QSSTSHRPPTLTLCPYTTLFRSWGHRQYHHALDREIAKLTAGDDHATRAARANAAAARDATARIEDDGTATVTITTRPAQATALDRKSTRLNSSHVKNSYAVFCL